MPSTIEAAPGRTVAPNGVVGIEPAGKRIRVSYAGQQILDTTGAVSLLEAGHSPVAYVPLADIDPSVLAPSDTHTFCPRKGTASYFSIVVGDHKATDAIWTYPEHLPDALDLSEYVAFYRDRIDSWDETDA